MGASRQTPMSMLPDRLAISSVALLALTGCFDFSFEVAGESGSATTGGDGVELPASASVSSVGGCMAGCDEPSSAASSSGDVTSTASGSGGAPTGSTGSTTSNGSTGASGSSQGAGGEGVDGVGGVGGANEGGAPGVGGSGGSTTTASGSTSVVSSSAASTTTTTSTGSGLSANGDPCADGATCESGNCVTSVCCDTPCDGTCSACRADIKGDGEDGVCGPILFGSGPNDDSCVNNCGECDDGACVTTCFGSQTCCTQTTPGFCVQDPCL